MPTHAIYLGRQVGSARKTACTLELDGPEVFRSLQPIYDGARYLLAFGLADPDDMIETYRGTTKCMSGKVGNCAKFTVEEHDKHGLRLRKYEPFNKASVQPEAEDILTSPSEMPIPARAFDH